MKRYLLFAYYQYYPDGGFKDFQGSFDTIHEAMDAFTASGKDHCEIIDNVTWERAFYHDYHDEQ